MIKSPLKFGVMFILLLLNLHPINASSQEDNHVDGQNHQAKNSLNLRNQNLNGKLPDDLASKTYLTRLFAHGCKIIDLGPLKTLINLTFLDLQENNVEDLTPLGFLINLRMLNLEKNNFKNVSPLGSLKVLRFLDLSKNQIEDVSPLSSLTTLIYLGLYEIEAFNDNDKQKKTLELFPPSTELEFHGELLKGRKNH